MNTTESQPVVRGDALQRAYATYGRGKRFMSYQIGVAEQTLGKALSGQLRNASIMHLLKIADFFNLELVIEFRPKQQKEDKHNVAK